MEYKGIITPCYIIRKQEYINSIEEIMKEYNSRWSNNVIFGYSVKTNHLPYLMNIARGCGWWAEVVSPAEYIHSVRQGFYVDKIIYNGPQKNISIREACMSGGIVNLDNMNDVIDVCNMNPYHITASIGIRVNFNLERLCPGETTVENEVGRFGLSYENGDVLRAINMLRDKKIPVKGIHLHSSTNSRSLKVYEAISNMAIEITSKYNLDLEYIDIGGGFFGGNYFDGKPTISQYADTITSVLDKYFDSSKVTLVLEPGAAILATSADYLTKVINIRNILDTEVITVDGTCLHINPFMKKKQLTPCTIIDGGEAFDNDYKYIIGGSTCMEMDRLYPRDISCKLTIDSKLLFHCAGAYTMTHNSNFINLMPNIYVEEHSGEYNTIRLGEQYMMEI